MSEQSCQFHNDSKLNVQSIAVMLEELMQKLKKLEDEVTEREREIIFNKGNRLVGQHRSRFRN